MPPPQIHATGECGRRREARSPFCNEAPSGFGVGQGRRPKALRYPGARPAVCSEAPSLLSRQIPQLRQLALEPTR